jgi:hypothetical protein
MNLELILGLIKLGIEVYQNETRDKYLKQYIRIQKEFQDELNKGLNDRSDLTLDRLRYDAEQLARLLVKGRSEGK